MIQDGYTKIKFSSIYDFLERTCYFIWERSLIFSTANLHSNWSSCIAAFSHMLQANNNRFIHSLLWKKPKGIVSGPSGDLLMKSSLEERKKRLSCSATDYFCFPKVVCRNSKNSFSHLIEVHVVWQAASKTGNIELILWKETHVQNPLCSAEYLYWYSLFGFRDLSLHGFWCIFRNFFRCFLDLFDICKILL